MFWGLGMSFLQESWQEREKVVYPEIFGDIESQMYRLTEEVFLKIHAENIDPKWLNHGVFKCPPTASRPTWAYVTSGMSNPWEDIEPQQFSGLGVEFVLETKEEESWALELLQSLLAYSLLLESGQMGEYPPLDYGDRIPYALSEKIKAVIFSYPLNFPQSFNIKSGKVDLLQAVGVTSDELAYATRTASPYLRDQLIVETGGLVTSKERASIV